MTIPTSAPQHLHAKADAGLGEGAQRRGLASALAGLGHDDPGTVAAIRRISGLASLERRLAGATRASEVMEALLAATREIVGPAPAYAVYPEGEGNALRLLRRSNCGARRAAAARRWPAGRRRRTILFTGRARCARHAMPWPRRQSPATTPGWRSPCAPPRGRSASWGWRCPRIAVWPPMRRPACTRPWS